MGKIKEIRENEDKNLESAESLPFFDSYRDGTDLQSVHARINNETVFVSNINNTPGTHMGIIQNILAVEVARMYKDLDKINEEHIFSPEIYSKIKSSIRDLEKIGGKIAKAVQVNIKANKK